MKNTFGINFIKLKKEFEEQIKKAYVDGSKQGAITTLCLIYDTMEKAGLETTNFLFDLLRDIAKRNDCENLDEYIKNIFRA